MRARFGFRWRQIVHDLHTGLLFRPAMIAAAIALLGVALIQLERAGAMPRWGHRSWLFSDDPGSAQAVLGAIAGSMMAVVSIIYTVLLVALSLASMQFSPRILGGLIRDRASQRTLGVFIGTFFYCLAVMRAVRADPPWVATWAVGFAIVLALACLVSLIYFIHHIAQGIQVNNLADRIANETRQVIAQAYLEDADREPPALDGEVVAITASASGYLQLVDHAGLLALARRSGAAIHVGVEPGDFVTRGEQLAQIAPGPLSADAITACQHAFDLGPHRTMQQDVGFGFRQLVDVALKAISPAVNDPSTAATCIDQLGGLLAELANRRVGPFVLGDRAGSYVAVPQPDLEALVDLAFNQLRQYGRGDLAVSIRLLHALAAVGRACREPARRERLRWHAALVRDGLSESFLPADRARFTTEYVATAAVLGA